jgi:hypothetical protein
MSQKCVHNHCKRLSRAVCKCCNHELCLQHFWQHSDLATTQLKTLKKEMNEIDSRFKFLDISKSSTNFRQQLKQWRIDCYTVIDRFYDQKCQEFNQYVKDKVDNQREYIDQLQKRIDQFIEMEYGNQQDIDLLKSRVYDLDRKVDEIEQIPFPFIILPLVIDENLIQIKY